MPVPDEVPRLVKDHNSLVERVVAEVAILPAFRLATEIVRVKTAEPDHGRGVLGRSNGQTGRARDHDWHGEREGLRSSSVVDVEEVGPEPEKGSGVKMRLKCGTNRCFLFFLSTDYDHSYNVYAYSHESYGYD